MWGLDNSAKRCRTLSCTMYSSSHFLILPPSLVPADPTMTLFDHFRPARHSSRSNPSSRAGSRAGSPTHESPHNSGHSTPIHHLASLFTHHHHEPSSSSSDHSGAHGSSKKREYEFFPHTPPIGSGGYSDVLKARWTARGGLVVAVKVVRKEAVKDHAEYLKIIGP